MDALLEKVKQNLILDHAADDALLKGYITAAVSYPNPQNSNIKSIVL